MLRAQPVLLASLLSYMPRAAVLPGCFPVLRILHTLPAVVALPGRACVPTVDSPLMRSRHIAFPPSSPGEADTEGG